MLLPSKPFTRQFTECRQYVGKHKNKKPVTHCLTMQLQVFLAEEEGFEPPVPRGTMVFKTTAFDHSATPLDVIFPFRTAKITVISFWQTLVPKLIAFQFVVLDFIQCSVHFKANK